MFDYWKNNKNGVTLIYTTTQFPSIYGRQHSLGSIVHNLYIFKKLISWYNCYQHRCGWQY